jgi:hypothetical protein
VAPKPAANLRYLDVAVFWELWLQWELPELLGSLMPAGGADFEPALAVAALTLQRCTDPGSKLYATRWFPRTALPELLGVAPRSFNNTRLHRVLDALDDVTPGLMRKLPRLYADRDGPFVTLFLDVTDACFVGHGPELAEAGKAKDGAIRRKIGIVLLCNEHGYPLRWEVVGGTRHDSAVMEGMCRSLKGVSWVGDAPVVCDRAMGRTAQIQALLSTGVRFLTALTTTEFAAYSQSIPHAPFAELEVEHDDEHPGAKSLERAAELAQAAGMLKVEDDLFVLDLGIVERAADETAAPSASDGPEEGEEPTVRAIRLARAIDDAVADGRHSSYAAAGRELGLGKSIVAKYRDLRRLPESIQRDILDGAAIGRTLAELITLSGLDDAEQQREAFAALLRQPAPARLPKKRLSASTRSAPPSTPVRVRAVVYFNPQRFVNQRLRARQRLAELDAFVHDLNRRLASPRSRMDERKIAAAVDAKLRRHYLLDAFELRVATRQTDGRQHHHVTLELQPGPWARRRRYDGFCLLVAHPDITQPAAELCRLYRAKDAVEKDFRVIKSLLNIHPVRHRIDAKVRAHVTLCMLALLLERTLRRKLAGKHTPEAALELLATCHLNLYTADGSLPAYTVTRTDADQDAILRALRLQHLADDQELAERITPR